MKKTKSFFAYITLIALIIGISSIQPVFAYDDVPQITDFYFDSYTFYIDLGTTKNAKAIMKFSDGSEKHVIDLAIHQADPKKYTNEYMKNNNILIIQPGMVFETSNPNVVTIDNKGNITGKSVGTAVITVTCGVRKGAAIVCVNEVKEMQAKADVPKDKYWIINFNRDVDSKTITADYISVFDSNNNKVNVGVNSTTDKRLAVITPPVGGYLPGQTYKLYINGNVKYTNSQNVLVNSYTMKFTIEK
ncbi:MAG: Ig-like domain-containing protein [Clostridia bacterium]|nr:Ig-like domain-containing protein [Clostridia bacterium]